MGAPLSAHRLPMLVHAVEDLTALLRHTGIFDQVPINYITKMGWAQEKNFALFLRKKKNLQKAP